MANILLKARLALELPPVNAALERAAHGLPEPVRPVALHILKTPAYSAGKNWCAWPGSSRTYW